MSDPCKHQWWEEKLGEPCPWCHIKELEAKLHGTVTTKYHDDLMHQWLVKVVKLEEWAASETRRAELLLRENERLRTALKKILDLPYRSPLDMARENIVIEALKEQDDE